jgi:hypothetical protein
MTIANTGDDVEPSADPNNGASPAASEIVSPPPGSNTASPAVGSGSAAAPGGAVDDPAAEESISIRVSSDPQGADVLLAGKPIGTTPLDTKIKRSNGQAILTVHRGGYEDVQTKIDLTADFEKALTLQKLEEPEEPVDDPVVEPDPIPKKHPVVVKEPRKDPRTTPRKEPRKEPRKDPVKEPVREPVKEPVKESVKESVKEPVKEPKKPSCQQPGQVDPFDPRPQCKT